MKTKKRSISVLIIVTGLLSAGCIVGIGDGRGGTGGRPTVGQELVDLQKARDAGAITPEEYAGQKKKLLAQ